MSEAVKNKKSELVAKKWAIALKDLVFEDETISRDDVLRDLKEVSSTIEMSDELLDVIDNPSISVEEKQIIICKLFQDRVLPIVYNFIFALNLKKRLGLVPLIAELFEAELENCNNILRVAITSAIDLDEAKKEDIKAKITEKLNKNVIADWNVDEDIVAGLIFNINETIIDNSIKHKLEDLSKMIVKS